MSKLTKLINSPRAFVGDAIKKRSPELYDISEGVYEKASLVLDAYVRPVLGRGTGLALGEAVVLGNSGLPRTFLIGFSPWKQFMVSWFPEREMHFIPKDISPAEFKAKWEAAIRKSPGAEIMVWGMKFPEFIHHFVLKNHIPLKFVEDGFIRSIALGATKAPPFSLNIDGRTPYFNAQIPSDLEVLLSTYDFDAAPDLLERAEQLIALLVKTGISKYNQSTNVNIGDIYGEKTRKRIMVVGQVEDDASILFGCDRRFTNNDAVMIAYLENPDAHIIYKPHPEILHKTRQMQSDPDEVRHICQVLDIDIPLAQSFETIDHVYTITSQAGFEALMRGIPVTTLGCPFYAGWGVTDDRQPNPRRTRKLTVQEIFAGTYLLYSRYFDPIYKISISAEEAVNRLNYLKTVANNPPVSHAVVETKTPASYGPKSKLYLFKFAPLKGNFMLDLFVSNSLEFIPVKITAASFKEEWASKIIAQPGDGIVVWGMQVPLYLLKFANENNIKIRYAEDGFIRPTGLGATHTPPLSITLDSRTPYFNATEPSDLEVILSTYNFQANAALLGRARSAMQQLIDAHLTECNQGGFVDDISKVYGVKTKKRILVLGQSEDDVAVLFGSERRYSNNDLVTIAYVENPDAQIIYKPHLDALHKTSEMQSNPDAVRHICQVVDIDLPLAQSFETIDHVYTITSHAGFEALMRGIPVTTLGCPFYSGWGLTDDRQYNPRRNRRLSVEEVFAGAYILHSRYYDPVYRKNVEIEEALARLSSMRKLALTALPSPAIRNVRVPAWFIGQDYQGIQRHASILLTDYDVEEIPADVGDEAFRQVWQPQLLEMQQERNKVFVWVPGLSKYVQYFLQSNGFEICYLDESPFSRIQDKSRHIGLTLDHQAPYRSATHISELECLLSSFNFDQHADVLHDAKTVLNQYLEQTTATIKTASRKKVLVIAESAQDLDASLGLNRGFNYQDAVQMAGLENPDSDIVLYVPANMVLTDDAELTARGVHVVHASQSSWVDVVAAATQVYTIASVLGFDALLRGKVVHTLGTPFYAGWGVTKDRFAVSQRTRPLSVIQLFAVSSLVYPVYVDTVYKQKVALKDCI